MFFFVFVKVDFIVTGVKGSFLYFILELMFLILIHTTSLFYYWKSVSIVSVSKYIAYL